MLCYLMYQLPAIKWMQHKKFIDSRGSPTHSSYVC